MTRLYYHGDRWGGDVHSLQWISATELASLGTSAMRIWNTKIDELQGVYALAFGKTALSPDGACLALTYESKVVIWSLAPHAVVQTLDCQIPVSALAWSPDGRTLATGFLTGPIALWDLATGRRFLTYREHRDRRIHHIVFSPDGKLIASNGFDAGKLEEETCKYLQIWDASSGELLWYPWGLTPRMRSLAWSPDSLSLVIGHEDADIDLLELHAERCTRLWPRQHSHPIERLAWSPSGKQLVSADVTMVCVWDMTAGLYDRLPHMYNRHVSPITAVAYAPDGKAIASAETRGQIHLWTPEIFQQEHEIQTKALSLSHPG
jgi:WD40 repeat protein